jgi:hypothetical protein
MSQATADRTTPPTGRLSEYDGPLHFLELSVVALQEAVFDNTQAEQECDKVGVAVIFDGKIEDGSLFRVFSVDVSAELNEQFRKLHVSALSREV